jgi:hypothetical protein
MGSGRAEIEIVRHLDYGLLVVKEIQQVRRPLFQTADDDRYVALVVQFNAWLANFWDSPAFDSLRAFRQRKFALARQLNGAISNLQQQPTLMTRRVGCPHC